MTTKTEHQTMTADEARDLLQGRSEDAEWTEDEIRDVFFALYGREPGDDDADPLSLAYAAL